MTNYKINILSLALLFVALFNTTQQKAIASHFSTQPVIEKDTIPLTFREFRGEISTQENQYARVQITIRDTLLEGFLQYQGDIKRLPMKGHIDSLNNFELTEQLGEYDLKKPTVISGKIENGVMKGIFAGSRARFKFVFEEIDMDNPPPFEEMGADKKTAFEKLSLEFMPINLPIEIRYKEKVTIKDPNFFIDKTIHRIGSYQEPFTLLQRIRYMEKLMYGGKIQFENDVTGLLVHAFFHSRFDGDLYASYLYIFDKNENFVKAFTVFEANRLDHPIIVTKLSGSEIFAIYDLREVYKFELSSEGTIMFLDRD